MHGAAPAAYVARPPCPAGKTDAGTCWGRCGAASVRSAIAQGLRPGARIRRSARLWRDGASRWGAAALV